MIRPSKSEEPTSNELVSEGLLRDPNRQSPRRCRVLTNPYQDDFRPPKIKDISYTFENHFNPP